MIVRGVLAGACFALLLGGCSNEKIDPSPSQEHVAKDEEKASPVFAISHRGASAYAPEHTFASYEMAENVKADYLEIDLQMTKDGKLVAMHDTTVDRTTNGTGKVKDMTLAQIKKLDAGSWFNETHSDESKLMYEGLKVPTLEEIFQRYGKKANYYIETKSPNLYPGMEEELLRLIDNYQLQEEEHGVPRIIVQSFSKKSLQNIHEKDPDLPLIQLISYREPAKISDQALSEIKGYADGIGMDYRMIDKPYIQKVRKAGLLVHPYTVNDESDMIRLIEWGADGMFTNQPDLLKKVKRNLERES
ncbi:glycerophosphodiester phosphodiesterase [Aciduricibacillus chroicocephali]|uniref:Glycerophosphodiester phosphodiesterase n=1 Tax=Aciduricibacillus chroicocephali TaxID=3054939 RepID=A0ABY9KU87_9BACI|nr:glycerophosphodiester phosphodiesterase [Bacillaceae bacterium 44XB]